ncbi:peptidoglycan DD-metalloendopeptidase family protein [Cellulomonas hominis]
MARFPRLSAHRRTRLVAAAVVALLAATTAVVAPAFADSLDDRRAANERKTEENQRQREELEASLEGLGEALQQAQTDLLAVEQQLPDAQAALATAQAELAQYQREVTIIAGKLQDAQDQQTTITATIATDSARSDEIRAAVAQLARQTYRDGPSVSSLGVILGAETTEDFIEQYGLAATAERTQRQVLDELTEIEATSRNSEVRLGAVKDRITELKAEADQKVVEADRARQQAADHQAEVESLITKQKAIKATIESQKADAQAQVDQLDADAASLASDLAGIIAEQRARDAAAAAAANKPAPPPPSGSVGSGTLFANPTAYNPMVVTSSYGMRLHPILGYYRLHAGIDLRSHCGNPLYAARAGTVQWARLRSGYGNQVMVDNGYVNGNSLMESYNHMSSFAVSAGQQVAQGQLLGYAGNTGTSAACHLHFEVYVNGSTVDPAPLLGL